MRRRFGRSDHRRAAADVDTAAATPSNEARSTTPVPTQDVTYQGRDGTLLGAYAPAATPKGAVLVIHENRGLVETTKAVAGRLGGDGYTALAVDLLSKEGGTATAGRPGELHPDQRRPAAPSTARCRQT